MPSLILARPHILPLSYSPSLIFALVHICPPSYLPSLILVSLIIALTHITLPHFSFPCLYPPLLVSFLSSLLFPLSVFPHVCPPNLIIPEIVLHICLVTATYNTYNNLDSVLKLKGQHMGKPGSCVTPELHNTFLSINCSDTT